MPFPPGYHPTLHGAPLARAIADARWVVANAEATLHATHTRIVDGVVGGLAYEVLEHAADDAVEARGALADGAEIIEQVAVSTYDPVADGHPGAVADRDRADLEHGRERAWTAHLTASAIIDRLDADDHDRHNQFLLDHG